MYTEERKINYLELDNSFLSSKRLMQNHTRLHGVLSHTNICIRDISGNPTETFASGSVILVCEGGQGKVAILDSSPYNRKFARI